ncbi:hypothetical protein D3C71_1538560 [compost metagenome]
MNNSQEPQIGAQMAAAISVAGSAASLARHLGVSTQAICFYRDGKRRLPEALGARIEALTGGKVTRKTLFPGTWRLVWPELVDSEEKQPPALEQQAQAAIKSEEQEAAHA